MAHVHLGLLADWLVITIRHQLKQQGINHNWQEIIRITNTQKIITTTGQNTFDEVVQVTRSQPNEKVSQIYQALSYKNYPFTKRKSVVPRFEFKKIDLPDLQVFWKFLAAMWVKTKFEISRIRIQFNRSDNFIPSSDGCEDKICAAGI